MHLVNPHNGGGDNEDTNNRVTLLAFLPTSLLAIDDLKIRLISVSRFKRLCAINKASTPTMNSTIICVSNNNKNVISIFKQHFINHYSCK